MKLSVYKGLALCTILIASLLVVNVSAEETKSMTPKDYLSGAAISVKNDSGIWTIKGKQRTVILKSSDLSVAMESAGVSWPLVASSAEDMIVQSGDKQFNLALKDAEKVDISNYDTGTLTGVKIDISGFSNEGAKVDLGIQLFIGIEGSGEDVVFRVLAKEGNCAIRELRWPGGLQAGFADRSVVPMMQGSLIPKDWPKVVRTYERLTHSRALYMPWWGFEKNGTAMGLILQTPDDAGIDLTHPAGGPTFIRPVFVHSLGKLSYARVARFCFAEKGNYVSLAKLYRKYMIETGNFVSLMEKIARTPLVAGLLGSSVVHTPTTWHCEPESIYFDKQDPANNDTCTTFEETADILKKLHGKGFEKIYLHLDGWGYSGYDNQHPDIIPPSPAAGGWDGMRKLGDVCEELGYIFAIHDQFRDYYTKASSYSNRHAVYDENGNPVKMAIWPGGDQGLLCASLAPSAVRRNHRALVEHGVKVRGAYLDVFAIVTPDECYNPEHPMTRTECLKYHSEAYGAVRSLLGIVSSEEPTVPDVADMDIVHHGPYALDPNPGSGPAMGVATPLFNLVYHDSIFMPWGAHPSKGGWGLPENDVAYCHAMLNAGIPYISSAPDDEEIKRVRKLVALHKRVGLFEMTDHEFLDAGLRKQRATYSDGTKVTVDFDSGETSIEPALTQDELDKAFKR